MSFKVTKDWIIENTISKISKVSAITASQAKILDLEWTEIRKKGWRKKVIGMEISNARKELFELLHGVSGKKFQDKVIYEFKRELAIRKCLIGHPKTFTPPTK